MSQGEPGGARRSQEEPRHIFFAVNQCSFSIPLHFHLVCQPNTKKNLSPLTLLVSCCSLGARNPVAVLQSQIQVEFPSFFLVVVSFFSVCSGTSLLFRKFATLTSLLPTECWLSARKSNNNKQTRVFADFVAARGEGWVEHLQISWLRGEGSGGWSICKIRGREGVEKGWWGVSRFRGCEWGDAWVEYLQISWPRGWMDGWIMCRFRGCKGGGERWVAYLQISWPREGRGAWSICRLRGCEWGMRGWSICRFHVRGGRGKGWVEHLQISWLRGGQGCGWSICRSRGRGLEYLQISWPRAGDGWVGRVPGREG